MAVQALVKGKGAGILNGHCPSPCPFFMDEKPGIVRFTPRSTSKSAMLIAVAVAVGVQVALCAVLVELQTSGCKQDILCFSFRCRFYSFVEQGSA